MNHSPAANYYRPTEEPEPLDLTQLNVEASVMCLASKIKFLCGRCGSPAIRLRQRKKIPEAVKTEEKNTVNANVVPDAVAVTIETKTDEVNGNDLNGGTNECAEKQFELETPLKGGQLDNVASAEGNTLTPPPRAKRGNKFTDGLDLSLTTDWASELRPSMKKLRQAMDGLLKTARLMHSVQRLQQDSKKANAVLTVTFRRDICFSQAVGVQLINYIEAIYSCNHYSTADVIGHRIDGEVMGDKHIGSVHHNFD